MTVALAYQGITNFITEGMNPESVAALRPSEAAKARVAELIDLEQTSAFSKEERSESGHYLQLKHLVRLAKARASTNKWVEPTFLPTCLNAFVNERKSFANTA